MHYSYTLVFRTADAKFGLAEGRISSEGCTKSSADSNRRNHRRNRSLRRGEEIAPILTEMHAATQQSTDGRHRRLRAKRAHVSSTQRRHVQYGPTKARQIPGAAPCSAPPWTGIRKQQRCGNRRNGSGVRTLRAASVTPDRRAASPEIRARSPHRRRGPASGNPA
jgi:hypothetical protein